MDPSEEIFTSHTLSFSMHHFHFQKPPKIAKINSTQLGMIPIFGRLRKKDCKLKTRLSYRARSWVIESKAGDVVQQQKTYKTLDSIHSDTYR